MWRGRLGGVGCCGELSEDGERLPPSLASGSCKAARWDGAGAGLRVITITGWGKEEKKKKHHNKSQQKQPICPTEKKSNHNEEEGEAQGTKLQRWVETNRDGMVGGGVDLTDTDTCRGLLEACQSLA